MPVPILPMPQAALSTALCVLLWTVCASSADASFAINELLTRNDHLVAPPHLDEDGDPHGWVEIINTGAVADDLQGWSLTNDATDPGRFTLPASTLQPGETIRVWLSGKDRTNPALPLHANFSLIGGGDLHLFDPQQSAVDSVVGTVIPPDFSYGRCPISGDSGYYFALPSPEAVNDPVDMVPFVIDQPFVSLPVGATFQLHVWPDVPVTWSSDNPSFVSVDASGMITALQDGYDPDGRATITATRAGGGPSRTTEVTIVSWAANVSRLTVTDLPQVDRMLGGDATGAYLLIGSTIHRATNGLGSLQPVGQSPGALASDAVLMTTPFGYFLRENTRLHFSDDLTTWSLALQTAHPGLQHMLAHDYDGQTDVGHVYVGEYSGTGSFNVHKVYRGTYQGAGPPVWETLVEFPSSDLWLLDPSNLDAVRHIHVVTVDPYTGTLYVATGDVDEHSRIYYSVDGGQSFELLGMGDQSWRTLAIWFTASHVYWSMDSSAPQSVWRIDRTYQQGGWPSMSPLLESGSTVPGVRYTVQASASPSYFPAPVGVSYVETFPRVLDALHSVRPANDPAYLYREQVAELHGNELWYQGLVSSDIGDPITLVATTASPGYRDDRPRVYGIKEGAGGVPNVQELLSLPDRWPSSSYRQLVPVAQDPSGFIYLRGRDTLHPFYLARLDWYDDEASVPGSGLAPPPPPPQCVPEPGTVALILASLPLIGLLAAHRNRGMRASDARVPRRTPRALVATASITIPLLACSPSEEPASFTAYDVPVLGPEAVRAELSSACQEAVSAPKPLLVEFSAEWCSDCQKLHRMKQEVALRGELARWPKVTVNVGRFDRHRDMLSGFGVQGIAHWVVLAPRACTGEAWEWPRLAERTLEPESGDARNTSSADLARWLAGLRASGSPGS